MKKLGKYLIWVLLTPVLMLAFMNCSQFDAAPMYQPSGTEVIQSSVEKQNVTVQSAEQLARSMASVTEVPYSDTILNEFNARRALMTTNYSLNSVNAPMLISVANLGSQYCNELIRIESAKPSVQRKHFSVIDFSKAPDLIDKSAYNSVINNFSFKFWGRVLSDEERTILTDAKNEFMQAIPAGSNGAANTKALMLSTCTSMLAALDFILI